MRSSGCKCSYQLWASLANTCERMGALPTVSPTGHPSQDDSANHLMNIAFLRTLARSKDLLVHHHRTAPNPATAPTASERHTSSPARMDETTTEPRDTPISLETRVNFRRKTVLWEDRVLDCADGSLTTLDMTTRCERLHGQRIRVDGITDKTIGFDGVFIALEPDCDEARFTIIAVEPRYSRFWFDNIMRRPHLIRITGVSDRPERLEALDTLMFDGVMVARMSSHSDSNARRTERLRALFGGTTTVTQRGDAEVSLDDEIQAITNRTDRSRATDTEGQVRLAVVLALSESRSDAKIHTLEVSTPEELCEVLGGLAYVMAFGINDGRRTAGKGSRGELLVVVADADTAFAAWRAMRNQTVVHLTPAEATYLTATDRPVPTPITRDDPRLSLRGAAIGVITVNYYRTLGYRHQKEQLVDSRVIVMAGIAGKAESDLVSRIVMETDARRIVSIDLPDGPPDTTPFTNAE